MNSLLRPVIALACVCLGVALLFIMPAGRALAHRVTGGPSFQVKAGFETRYRRGNWVPVRITLRNDGPDFSGALSLSAVPPQYLGQSGTALTSHYQFPISLPEGAEKQVTMYLPLYFDIQRVAVKLLDISGNAIVSQTAALNPLLPGSVFVGVLSDQTSGFGPLSTAPLPDQNSSVIVEFLDASTMPTLAAALKNFHAIVLDNFTTANLSTAQLKALQNWVYQGGALILAGGPQWRQTLGLLPAGLVPVALNSTATLAPGTPLLFPNASGTGPSGVQSPVTISTATMPPTVTAQFTSDEVVSAAKATPLMVQARQGQGTILYLAFDPTLQPISNWQGASALWADLLVRGIGDQLLAHASTPPSGTTSYSELEQPLLAYRMSALLQSLLPGTRAFPWWSLLVVFAGYLLVPGILRFLLLKKLKWRDWSWRIMLGSLVVFSLLSYGLAYKERGEAIVSNSITTARLGQNGLPASLTTYMGVFVANEGDVHIRIPGNVLAQPSPDALLSPEGKLVVPADESTMKITPVIDGTDLTLQDAGNWTLHSVLFERQQQVPGSLTSHLAIQNGMLIGSVSNALGYTLDDAFLLLPNQALSLGRLAAGQTKQVRLKLSSTPLPPNATLADLLARVTRSPAYNALPALPGTAWQRHLATLYALDGEGFYSSAAPCTGSCAAPVPILPFLPTLPGSASQASSGTPNHLITPGWPYSGTWVNDPLLVPDSAATLIGWTGHSLDAGEGVRVNDMQPAGLHETLIQAPLAVNLSGALNLPPNFIAGRLVAAEGSGKQAAYPGMYTISNGSMTFEYDIPNISGLRISGLSIAEPPNLNLYDPSGTVVDPYFLPFHLYNWHSHAWDAFSLYQDTYTTNAVSAYIGPGGSVLVELDNENGNSWLGPFTFGKPLLDLQGLVSNHSPAYGQQAG